MDENATLNYDLTQLDTCPDIPSRLLPLGLPDEQLVVAQDVARWMARYCDGINGWMNVWVDTQEGVRVRWWETSDMTGLLDIALRAAWCNITRRDGVHLTLNPRHQNMGRSRGKTTDVSQIGVIWAEFDGEPDRVQLHDLGMKPHDIVFTGRGYHYYWQILPINLGADQERRAVDETLKEFARYLGADVGAANLHGSMRIPGTYHSKEGRQQFKVQRIETSNHLLYDLQDFARFKPVERRVVPPKPIFQPLENSDKTIITIEEVVRLTQAKPTMKKNQWVGHCPATGHGKGKGDKHPSMSISYDGDAVAMHCHSGCSIEDICAGMHVPVSALFHTTSRAETRYERRAAIQQKRNKR